MSSSQAQRSDPGKPLPLLQNKWDFPRKYMVVCEPEEINEVVDYYVQHEDERQTLVDACLADLRENHSVQVRAKQMVEMLR